jgi:hypothetical protein
MRVAYCALQKLTETEGRSSFERTRLRRNTTCVETVAHATARRVQYAPRIAPSANTRYCANKPHQFINLAIQLHDSDADFDVMSSPWIDMHA